MKPDCEMVSTHAARVGAIAGELGAAMGLDEATQQRLRNAGRRHECAVELFTQEAYGRLTADLVGKALPVEAPGFIDQDTFAILRAFADPRCTSAAIAQQVEILLAADAIDNDREFEAYRNPEDEDSGPYVSAGLAKLRRSSLDELRGIVARLPVFPAAAVRAVAVLTGPDADGDGIEQIASSDPVLAGTLLSAANSALYSPRQEIRSVGRAITHIGCVTAKSVLLAAALRPVFGVQALRPQWRHALEASDGARQLAARTRVIPEDEAALAGLVHDIGVLALSLVSQPAQLSAERLMDAGHPQRGAEWLSCGFDHAEASAAVLEAWHFPESIVKAVRHHHTPEQSESELASLLYLTEFWTCSDEDIPSTLRLNVAAKRVRTTPDSIVSMKAERRLTAILPV